MNLWGNAVCPDLREVEEQKESEEGEESGDRVSQTADRCETTVRKLVGEWGVIWKRGRRDSSLFELASFLFVFFLS